jgi:hypothetical protein
MKMGKVSEAHFRHTPAPPGAVKAEKDWPGFAKALAACRAVKGVKG